MIRTGGGSDWKRETGSGRKHDQDRKRKRLEAGNRKRPETVGASGRSGG